VLVQQLCGYLDVAASMRRWLKNRCGLASLEATGGALPDWTRFPGLACAFGTKTRAGALRALRGRGEDYSQVILRLAAEGEVLLVHRDAGSRQGEPGRGIFHAAETSVERKWLPPDLARSCATTRVSSLSRFAA
jgi:hypothetical protein